MRELIKEADIILPNITEACYMTGIEYVDKFDKEYIERLLKELHQYTKAKIILTDVSFKANQTGVYFYDGIRFQYYKHHKIGEGIHGTGDIFFPCFIHEES